MKQKHSTVYVGINSQPYFEHHGRLGMKWGKRNGPPYPLDYSKLSEEERAKDKQRVKDEGDIESVGYKKNRSYFTDQEINEVINRYQLNTRINQLAADSAKMKAGKSKTEELTEKLQKVSDVGFKLGSALQAGTNVYNNVAKIMNAMGDSDLPIIGEKKAKDNISFKGDVQNILKNIDMYTDNQVADMAKRTENINKIMSSKTLKDFIEKGKPQDNPKTKEVVKEVPKQTKTEQKPSREEQRQKAFEDYKARDAAAKEQKAQSIKSDIEKVEKAKEEYSKAGREMNEAEAQFRRGGYDDLDYRNAAVKDAKFELATKNLDTVQKEIKSKYGNPEDYSPISRVINKTRYEKAVEFEKEQKKYADEQKIKRLEAEEKAIEEERKKRGQAYVDYYI